MKTWDLGAGMAKLELAIQSLHKANVEAMQYWDDETHRQFRENHLKPLEPKVKIALDAIHRLDQTLAEAHRECGPW